ncbi:DUF6478 family protein [Chachezhania antarctica]|uniref:DUF6478 family protein n=1 Tax=Chachezhania antarctica TaxID=2340860 RepID=UPI000EB353DA|nr:DUF6478 family protein [Chachezhania antarctica]
MASFFDLFLHRRTVRRWRKAARDAPTVSLTTLKAQRTRARQLRAHIDRLIHVADGRLALPRIDSSQFQKPHGTDWAWRPEAWRGPLTKPGLAAVPTRAPFGNEATLFHDCDVSEVTLRQIRNLRPDDLAAFGLRLDVFRFDGSFLSLVIDLPNDAAKGLSRSNLIRVNTIIESEKPLEIFARLNVRHGPNTEQVVRELPLHEEDVSVDFDLAYSKLNERRIEKVWLDLIFEAPEMNQIILRDVTFARYMRASI